MKTALNYIFLLAISSLLILGSCQQEVIEITEPEDNTVITIADSTVSTLVQNTAMRDGSSDNIIDNSSCTTIVLPITVIANGQTLIINTEDDFKLIERLFDESETDDDNVEMVFPITVILSDHTELTINTEEEFEALLSDCVEGGDDDDIECIDFVYPIEISLYDAANQVTDIITVTDDEELYNLFESLEDEDVISLNFPVSLTLADGSIVEVNNNDELEELIEDAKDDCDEDDDSDHNDDDVDDTDFIATLITGDWAISYFFDEGDGTADFQNYVFTFLEDGSASAIAGDITFAGTWATYGDDGNLELELDFGSEEPFDQIEEDWYIADFETDLIKLGDEDEEGESEEFLTFERPTEGGGGGNEPTLSDIIIEGDWSIANYTNADVDETTNYTGFSLAFSNDGTLVVTNDTQSIEGDWEESEDNGVAHLELDFGSEAPFEELGENWEVVSFTNDRIELTNANEDETTDTLVFEKL